MRFLNLLLALQQVQVHRKRISYASSIAFSSLKVLPVLRYGRFHTSPFLVFYLLTFLGVYLHKEIELVLRFSKSSSLLKLESGCKRYRVFRVSCFQSVPDPVDRSWNRTVRFNRPGTDLKPNQTPVGLQGSPVLVRFLARLTGWSGSRAGSTDRGTDAPSFASNDHIWLFL